MRCTVPKPEIDHTGLVRVQLQPVLPQPLPKHFQYAFGVVFVRKQRHKVIAVANQSARLSVSDVISPKVLFEISPV